MTELRYVSWPNFKRHYLDPGDPATLVVDGRPQVRLEVGERAQTLTLLVETPGANSMLSPLANVEIARTVGAGTSWISVKVSEYSLFRPFYDLSLEIADRIQLDSEDADHAIANALDGWQALLATRYVLSREEQVGLIGELWLLCRLAQAQGLEAALSAWSGPEGDAQDFRLAKHEFEVKTTLRAERIHQFSGARQLQPSTGHDLHIVSLQLATAGPSELGFTLPALVESVRETIGERPKLRARFRAALERVEYRDSDASHYSSRYVWRSPALLVSVDQSFPTLTNEMVRGLLPPDHQTRLRGIQFDLILDGMGYEDGTPQFLALLPQEAAT